MTVSPLGHSPNEPAIAYEVDFEIQFNAQFNIEFNVESNVELDLKGNLEFSFGFDPDGSAVQCSS